MFLAAIQLSLRHRLVLTWLLLFLGALSLVLGFLQMAQGPNSSLRFYEVTNAREAVGFFANRNHFVAQLYVTLVLAAVWYASTARQMLRERSVDVALGALANGRSRFSCLCRGRIGDGALEGGIIPCYGGSGGSRLMVLRQRIEREDGFIGGRVTVGRMSIVAVLFAVLFAAQFGLGSIMSRFEGDEMEELRVPFATTTLETALRSLPFGTGLGSFVSVYATVRRTKTFLTALRTGRTMISRKSCWRPASLGF